MIVIVTGTPGTGKTRYAKALAKKERYTYLDVNKIIETEKLSEGYDKERDCALVDVQKLVAVLKKIILTTRKKKESLVIDSHLSHYLPAKIVDRCVVMRCSDHTELRRRLRTRGYNSLKIKENLEAEIMETCLQEAIELGHRVEVIDQIIERCNCSIETDFIQFPK